LLRGLHLGIMNSYKIGHNISMESCPRQEEGSGGVVRRHAAFVPARQKRLGFRLRSPLPSVEEPCPLSLQTAFSPLHLRLIVKKIYLRKNYYFKRDIWYNFEKG